MTLFLMNAVAGRVWYGYMCPQTIWTDLFCAVERFGLSDNRGWTLTHIRQAATKHFIWLIIAWWTGGAWVLYFADAPTLVKDLATFQAPFIAYLWIAILPPPLTSSQAMPASRSASTCARGHGFRPR